MKLSKKGMLKLKSFVLIMNNFNVTTEDIKFEPDDFQGAVVLTVEEAKHLLSIVMDCKHAHCITQEEAKTFVEFVKRIEQVEKAQ